jgi:hypothetical protein
MAPVLGLGSGLALTKCEPFKPENLRTVNINARRVVVCMSCKAVVAEDYNRPEDVPLVTLAVENHLFHPRFILSDGICHEMVTADMKTKLSDPGVRLEKIYTD